MTGTQSAGNGAADLQATMTALGRAARNAAAVLANATSESKDGALREAATALRDRRAELLQANAQDVAAAEERDLRAALVDRLKLDEGRVEAMAAGLEEVAAMSDPIGKVVDQWERPNGLQISRVRTPLGVIGIIYESRPNVTADAGGLCLKSGNAAVLRGGSESFYSSGLIGACLHDGLRAAGLPEAAVQLLPTTDRAAVGVMLTMSDYIDIIVPRGGKGLIERVQNESKIPVIAHLDGICHVYVDGAADLEMARKIAVNAKMRRVSICGAAETLLVDKRVHNSHLEPIVHDLLEAGCEVRGDPAAQAIDPRVAQATEEDWETEYLDSIISVRVVDGVDGAIDHIGTHGSHHTDSIITEDTAVADHFLSKVDSAIVLWNASTQFADGGEFGMGAEIGISTGKLHARGPVGAEQLTTYKYVVRGDGQVRP
jgi:glutamate-5-semialdehyde dehydrogenase